MELMDVWKYESQGWPITRLLFKTHDKWATEIVFSGAYLSTLKHSYTLGVRVDSQAFMEYWEYVAPTQDGGQVQ